MEFKTTDNPYTLQFSYIPPQFIERKIVTAEILDNFTKNVPTYRGMFITGVRGSGKTVMLGNIRSIIGEKPEWITVDINPESNILEAVARGLYLKPELKALFVKAKLDFSFLGIGVHIENAELIASNEEDALHLMLKVLKKAKKKLLVTIDEVTYSKDIARFSHALSSYAGEDYDIYLLMTGLAENINNIKNKKSLTFFFFFKVKELDTLNITAICKDYEKVFKTEHKIAEELAYTTKGYSLAFQALGYLYWEALCKSKGYADIDMPDLYSKLDDILAELAYDKIWEELSLNDKNILKTMLIIEQKSDDPLIKVEDIRNMIKMSSDSFTTYRKRLIESGIVDGSQYGYLKFKLPRFEEYIKAIQ